MVGKTCSRCGEFKASDLFYRSKFSKDRRKSSCKACAKVYAKSEKGAAANRKHAQSNKRKEWDRNYNRAGARKAIWDRYNKSDKRKKAQKKYMQSSRGIQADRRATSKRRTRKTLAGGEYTSDEWYSLCKYYDFCCLKCNKKFPFNQLTVDHIKPVAKGGSSFIWNIQPLCIECNKTKGVSEIDYRKILPNWINRDSPIWIQDSLF